MLGGPGGGAGGGGGGMSSAELSQKVVKLIDVSTLIT